MRISLTNTIFRTRCTGLLTFRIRRTGLLTFRIWRSGLLCLLCTRACFKGVYKYCALLLIMGPWTWRTWRTWRTWPTWRRWVSCKASPLLISSVWLFSVLFRIYVKDWMRSHIDRYFHFWGLERRASMYLDEKIVNICVKSLFVCGWVYKNSEFSKNIIR